MTRRTIQLHMLYVIKNNGTAEQNTAGYRYYLHTGKPEPMEFHCLINSHCLSLAHYREPTVVQIDRGVACSPSAHRKLWRARQERFQHALAAATAAAMDSD